MNQPENSNQNHLKILFWLNLTAILLGAGFLTLKFSVLPDQVPLFYSCPWGEDQLTAKPFLFLIPTSSLAVFLLNFTTVKLLAKRGDSFLSYIGQFFAFLFSVFGLITLIKIILLVT